MYYVNEPLIYSVLIVTSNVARPACDSWIPYYNACTKRCRQPNKMWLVPMNHLTIHSAKFSLSAKMLLLLLLMLQFAGTKSTWSSLLLSFQTSLVIGVMDWFIGHVAALGTGARCGLLLPMFCGLYVCVCACVAYIGQPHKTAELIKITSTGCILTPLCRLLWGLAYATILWQLVLFSAEM